MKPPVPILRSFDERKMRDFYEGFLGFEASWTHRFEEGLPLYCELRRGDCVLHLSEHHGDATPGSALRIEVPDIDAFHAALPKDYGNARPGIGTQPWGREVCVTDPFGNRLIFWQAP